jgi:hypothetical protein
LISLALLGAGLAATAPPAFADDPAAAGAVAAIRAGLQDAAVRLAAGDRVGAVGSLDAAVETAGTLDASDIEATGARRKATKAFNSVKKRVRDALRKTNNAVVQPLTAQRSIGRAIIATSAADTALQRAAGAPFLLQETRARSAGFHEPGAIVEFRVDRSAACDEEPVVTIVDQGGGAIVVQPVQLIGQGPGPRFFDIDFGNVPGAGRVEVSACGVTRTWLLFNKGENATYPVLPKPEISRFDGTYTGGYQGRATAYGLSQAVAGGVTLTVTNGRITVSSPGGGRGSIGTSGRSRFGGGSGGTGDASYRFGGVFVEHVVGGVSASGNWTASFEDGSARGTWSASR